MVSRKAAAAPRATQRRSSFGAELGAMLVAMVFALATLCRDGSFSLTRKSQLVLDYLP